MGSGHGKKFADKNWELAVINRALEQWGVTGPEGHGLSARQIRTRAGSSTSISATTSSSRRPGATKEAFLRRFASGPATPARSRTSS